MPKDARHGVTSFFNVQRGGCLPQVRRRRCVARRLRRQLDRARPRHNEACGSGEKRRRQRLKINSASVDRPEFSFLRSFTDICCAGTIPLEEEGSRTRLLEPEMRSSKINFLFSESLKLFCV